MKITALRFWSPRGLVLIASACALLGVCASRIKAFNPQPDPPGVYGMMGITPVDTLRINVVNVQLAGLPSNSCSVTLRFLNAQGQVLKGESFAVKPTQSVSLDLTGVEANAGFRTEIHPVVLVPGTNPVGCSAVSSAEIFNTTSGETTVMTQPVYVPLASKTN